MSIRRDRRSFLLLCVFGLLAGLSRSALADRLGSVAQYHVFELPFTGPAFGPRDAPAKDVRLLVTFRHASGRPELAVPGFWDGDGRGGNRGTVFKVRFCPDRPGTWTVVKTASNRRQLAGRHVGDTIVCTRSAHPGFWIPDGRWYRRSDGSHPVITGNTHYTFLSRHGKSGRLSSDPVEDVRGNAKHFQKLRFSLFGGRYPDPKVKPFLDDSGRPSDDGRYSFRPNPQWFHTRVDPVVAEGHKTDLICDLLLCGPDTFGSRSTLKGDPHPWLRYVAARYGAYPNVWFCLCNEWNIKRPHYSAKEIRSAGAFLKSLLPQPRPISVHSNTGPWRKELNGDWHDHVVIQHKLKTIPRAADAAAESFRIGRKPVLNDENAYQGKGDNFTFEDTVEGCFGTFLGGGYPTTGEKYGRKLGQYFWGGFDPERHTAARSLKLLRDYVNANVAFWTMRPLPVKKSAFRNAPSGFRLLGRPGREYVLGSNAGSTFPVDLPAGKWKIVQIDLLSRKTTTLAAAAGGRFTLKTPASRAVMTHFRKRGGKNDK